MAYEYSIINKLDQFGITIFTIKLKDTDNILPEVLIPAFLHSDVINEESIKNLCDKVIQEQTVIQNNILNKKIQINNEFLEEVPNDTPVLEEVPNDTPVLINTDN